LGAFGPGNRQLVSSWLQQKDLELSPFLQEAVRFEDGGTEIILAIDATDALTPALVEQRLTASKETALASSKLSVQEIARLVSSLKGVMLGITFGKQPYGKIKIDFGQDVTALSDIAKPLVLDALANHGALIDEMSQWQLEMKGTSIYLGGNLGESGLMRISSLINLPTHALHAPATGGGTPSAAGADTTAQAQAAPNQEQVVQEKTQQYFKSVEGLLRDLRSQKGEARTIGQIGVWFGTYANRVDRLPILNIDQQMLQYGQYVAQQLRNCSMAIKGYGINKRVAEVNADNNAAPFGGVLGDSASDYYANGAYGRPLGYGAAYGWASRQGAAGTAYWAGRSEMRQAMAARTAADVQLKAGAAGQVQQIMEQLSEAHEKIRVMMTEKYKVEF
jgi:hypothetical protein